MMCVPSEASLPSESLSGTICRSLYTRYLCGDCIYLTSYRQNGGCKACPDNVSKYFTIIAIFSVFSFICWRFLVSKAVIPGDIRLVFSSAQIIALYPNFSSSWPSNIIGFFIFLSFTMSSPLPKLDSKYYYYRTSILSSLLLNAPCR